MINVLFSCEDLSTLGAAAIGSLRKISQYIISVDGSVPVNGRTLNTANVDNMEIVAGILWQLQQFGKTPHIVGLWETSTGFQVGCNEDTRVDPAIFPLDISEYSSHLVGGPFTDEEARNIQVGSFYGMPPRNMKDI